MRELVTTAQVVGSGPRRVMISHGWIADSRMFDAVIDHVDRDAFTVALVDHRGYGTRCDETCGLDLDTSAVDLLAAADALGWDRFGLVGHSMGGLAAQRLAADHPERLTSLVLVAAVPAGGGQLEPSVLADRLAHLDDLTRRRANIDTNSHHEATANAVWAMHLDCASTAVLAQYLRSFATADFSDALACCTVPTLVLSGRDDPAISPALMDRTVLQWFTDVQHVVLPTGHYPMVQSPKTLWDHCAGHLR